MIQSPHTLLSGQHRIPRLGALKQDQALRRDTTSSSVLYLPRLKAVNPEVSVRFLPSCRRVVSRQWRVHDLALPFTIANRVGAKIRE
jgi:hypothetical protein